MTMHEEIVKGMVGAMTIPDRALFQALNNYADFPEQPTNARRVYAALGMVEGAHVIIRAVMDALERGEV